MTQGPILVVDDERDIRDLIALSLQREGLPVLTAGDGAEALRLARARLPSLVVLDLMLPGMSGTEVCRQLRAAAETAEVPVLILTARTDEIDRVVGFEVGADDYVMKPFSVRELVLRIRAILRRGGMPEAGRVERLEHGPLAVDPAAHRVWVSGEELQLTATEFRLLITLARRSGRVQSRGQLLRDVWDAPPDLNTRTVDTHVKRLREKLGEAANYIETVRGVGYRFTP